MSGRQRLVFSACAPLAAVLACLGSARPARAQAAGSMEISESIDDPKIERRLGTRIELVDGAAPASDATPVPGAAAADAGVVSPLVRADAVAAPGQTTPVVAPRVPHLKVAYRWLTLAHLAAGGVAGRGADETFHVVSLDFYPVSSVVRMGLSTQYGWESGTFRAGGDAFFAESISLGFQIPGQVFTPFFEGHAGVGYMQRMNVALINSGTIYLPMGVDFGTEIFFARFAHLSLALGYVHAVNYFAGNDPVQRIAATKLSMDSMTIKVGFGI